MPTKNDSVTGQNMQALDFYNTHPAQRAKISFVATPIGNLSDMSPRSIRYLQECDEIWCEDTRHTQQLLNALKIVSLNENQRLRRFDQHVSPKELERLLEAVSEKGQWIVVVTDAGTPGISDPGAMIASGIHRFPQIKLEPVPGPSAVSAFVSIAGFHDNSFQFKGFFPRERKDALRVLEDLQGGGTLFFESPKRLSETIGILKDWCAGLDVSPRFTFAKEITKLHETIYSGSGQGFLLEFSGQEIDERGEWVFSIELPNNYLKNKKTVSDWQLAVECLVEAGIPTKTASQLISSKFQVAKNLAYDHAIEMQKKIKKT